MSTRPPVLVTDGGDPQSRSALACVRALARGGYDPVVTFSSRLSITAASRDCAARVRTPDALDPGFAAAITAELGRRPYVTVLATSDVALLALGAPVGHLTDKGLLAERAVRAGLDVPPTRVFASRAELLAAADALEYPVVVKPVISRHPPYLARSAAAIGQPCGTDEAVVVQPYLTDPLRAVAGVSWHGGIVAAVHQRYERTWPATFGTSCAAVTVAPDPDTEAALVRLLAGYDGVFQAQFAGPYLLDVNPRPFGSLPLSVAAGANLPAIYCDLLRGADPPPVRATPGVRYRWLDGDVRNVVGAVRSGALRPLAGARAVWPRRGTAHSVESVRDPLPMLVRLMAPFRRVGRR